MAPRRWKLKNSHPKKEGSKQTGSWSRWQPKNLGRWNFDMFFMFIQNLGKWWYFDEQRFSDELKPPTRNTPVGGLFGFIFFLGGGWWKNYTVTYSSELSRNFTFGGRKSRLPSHMGIIYFIIRLIIRFPLFSLSQPVQRKSREDVFFCLFLTAQVKGNHHCNL